MAKDKTRGIEFSLSKTTQKVNLKELLGRTPTAAEKELFVSEAIEKIIGRTQSGESIHGKSFKPYSKEYAEVKGSSEVDMTLTGDMLLSMERKQRGKDEVEFGIYGGVEAKKSYNHNTGDTLPKRTWFGLKKSEAKEIAASIKEQDLSGVTAKDVSESREVDLLSIIKSLRLEVDDDKNKDNSKTRTDNKKG